MDRYAQLISRARVGERIIIDGGTGSECIRRGAPELANGWSGGAALSNPDIVRQIHADYISLGADLVVSNTFATGRNGVYLLYHFASEPPYAMVGPLRSLEIRGHEIDQR